MQYILSKPECHIHTYTYTHDHALKLPSYASHSIPTQMLINLNIPNSTTPFATMHTSQHSSPLTYHPPQHQKRSDSY